MASATVIHAKDLKIYERDNSSHWKWRVMTDTADTGDEQVVVAELLSIHKLDVSTMFPFTPGTKYRVEFVLKKNDEDIGFENNPVTFQLAFSHGDTFEIKHDLSQSLTNNWTYVPAGAFTKVSREDLKISMFEHGSQEKGGIIVDKIVISPECD